VNAISKNSLIARLSDAFTEAAAVHTPVHARCALSAVQLRRNGSHASVSLSSFQPGIAFQVTGFKLLAQVISGAAGVGLGVGVGAGVVDVGGVGLGLTGLGVVGAGLTGLGLTGLGLTGLGLPGPGLTGSGLLGTLAHAVIPSIAAYTKSLLEGVVEVALTVPRPAPVLHLPLKRECPMLWLALEIVLGVVLFVFIVWWTLPRRRKPDNDDSPN